MSHECNDSCCGSHHHAHHQHYGYSHHHGECSCCCHCECSGHHQGKFSKELLELADQAWMDVLKESIMDEIRRTSGEHLKKMAKLVNETNHERWKELMSEKKGFEDFEARLKGLLYGSQKK